MTPTTHPALVGHFLVCSSWFQGLEGPGISYKLTQVHPNQCVLQKNKVHLSQCVLLTYEWSPESMLSVLASF
jgi:hypothetical protein